MSETRFLLEYQCSPDVISFNERHFQWWTNEITLSTLTKCIVATGKLYKYSVAPALGQFLLNEIFKNEWIQV